MADMRVGGECLVFAAEVWAEEVDRLKATSQAHRRALEARKAIKRPGARVALRACEAEAEDGTRLAGCAKVYVPLDREPSQAPYGLVFSLETPTLGGRPMALLLAYGERHPTAGHSVYERAHKRLHGRYHDQ